MANIQRIRQEAPDSFAMNNLVRQMEQGWKLVAVEWERETASDAGTAQVSVATSPSESIPASEGANAIPYGLQVVKDPPRVEPDGTEQEVLFVMMELTIQDGPYSVIAEELNQRGFRTRTGMKWSPISVFQMLPRLIEVGPKIFATKEWQERRTALEKSGSR
jgi:hypothetical protein